MGIVESSQVDGVYARDPGSRLTINDLVIRESGVGEISELSEISEISEIEVLEEEDETASASAHLSHLHIKQVFRSETSIDDFENEVGDIENDGGENEEIEIDDFENSTGGMAKIERGNGIHVTHGGHVSLDTGVIEETASTAVMAMVSGSVAEISQVLIMGARAAIEVIEEDGLDTSLDIEAARYRHGIAAVDGGSITLRESTIAGKEGAALLLRHGGDLIEISEVSEIESAANRSSISVFDSHLLANAIGICVVAIDDFENVAIDDFENSGAQSIDDFENIAIDDFERVGIDDFENVASRGNQNKTSGEAIPVENAERMSVSSATWMLEISSNERMDPVE